MTAMILWVTGAAGFLGQHIVRQALAAGHEVHAVVRPGRAAALNAGGKLHVIELDLSAAAPSVLVSMLSPCRDETTAVIHAAGVLAGSDEQQCANTVAPTRRLLEAMDSAGLRRLVLVSSLSVYGYAALPEGALLDETMPTEHHPARRDAYCRAKLAQEALALAAAQACGLRVTALRAGTLFGPGRLWNARLGAARGSLAVLLGGGAAMPLAYVEHCAQAAVFAAQQCLPLTDVHATRDARGMQGSFEAINVVDDDLPLQRQYAALIRGHGPDVPRYTLRLPWRLVRRVADACALAGAVVPGLYARLPGVLRVESLHARYKPLRYSNCRLHDRLGWRPLWDCAGAVARSIEAPPDVRIDTSAQA